MKKEEFKTLADRLGKNYTTDEEELKRRSESVRRQSQEVKKYRDSSKTESPSSAGSILPFSEYKDEVEERNDHRLTELHHIAKKWIVTKNWRLRRQIGTSAAQLEEEVAAIAKDDDHDPYLVSEQILAAEILAKKFIEDIKLFKDQSNISNV